MTLAEYSLITMLFIYLQDNPVDSNLQRNITTSLLITILDGDDQGPVFEYSSCQTFDGFCYAARYSTSITGSSSVSILKRFRLIPILDNYIMPPAFTTLDI